MGIDYKKCQNSENYCPYYNLMRKSTSCLGEDPSICCVLGTVHQEEAVWSLGSVVIIAKKQITRDRVIAEINLAVSR